jgi:hypothetical protein
VIGLCDRWHCPPSQVLAEDARVLRLLDIYRQGHREDGEDEEGGEDG